MNKVNVLFKFSPEKGLIDYLQKGLADYPQIRMLNLEGDGKEKQLEFAPAADAAIGWGASLEFLEAATKLKLFINPGAGVQGVVPVFAKLDPSRNVALVNGHGNSYFTAQHAVAMLLALMNKVIAHHAWMVDGRWRLGDGEGVSTPLRDRKVGLIGYGAVNSKVHKFLSGFDVEFGVLRNSWPENLKTPTPVKKYCPDELHAILEWADILIVAIPMMESTEGMIGAEELKLLGETGLVINMARGPVVHEESFYNALKGGGIAGAGIDVWYNYGCEPDENGEKHPASFPFHKLDNVVLSPHRGASPMNDLRRWDEVIENLSRLARGETEFINTVVLERGY